MKKILWLLFIFFLWLFSPMIVSAQSGTIGGINCRISDGAKDVGAIKNVLKECQWGQGVEAYSSTGSATGVAGIKEKIQNISVSMLKYIALFAVGVLVFAGIQYTIAYDNSDKLQRAKGTAIFAVVGLLIALASYSLVNAVIYILFSLGK